MKSDKAECADAPHHRSEPKAAAPQPVAAEAAQLRHELQLRQIELDSQTEKLRESQAELQLALARLEDYYDFAPVGYLTLDASGLILEANLTIANLLGEERHLLVGKPISGYLMAEDQDVFRHHIDQYFDTGASLACEVLFLPKGRPPVWARLELPPARAAGIDRLSPYRIVIFDITDRKQIEETKLKSERQLNDLIDFLPDATLAVDSQKKIIVWNKAIERMTGLKAEEMIGKGNYEYSLPFYGDRRPILMDRAWEREQDIAQSYSQLDREGKSLSAETFCPALYGGRGAHVFAKVSPLHDQNGRVVGAIESIRDISDLKLAEDKLGKAYAELESRVEERTLQLAESNRDLQYFAHMTSHDLREPLLLIQAFGRRLALKYGSLLDESGQGYLKRIEVLTDRMTRLLESILLYSRVASKPNLTGPVDLTQVAREVISDLQMRIESTGGQVELADLGVIEADHLQMHQLLQNLLANALKYHHPARPPVVRITSQLQQNEAGISLRRITVEDNGIGFDDSQGARLFEIFHRHHPEGFYEGSGIGLAICKRIVERHGGAITATGKHGEGAIFSLVLPVKQPDARPTPTP